MSKIINASEFPTEVLNASVPVLVDFYADWCGPCKMMSPALDKISEEYAGKAKVVKKTLKSHSSMVLCLFLTLSSSRVDRLLMKHLVLCQQQLLQINLISYYNARDIGESQYLFLFI